MQKISPEIILVQRVRSKYSFDKFSLYNYIRENNFRAFSAHEYIFTKRKRITVYPKPVYGELATLVKHTSSKVMMDLGRNPREGILFPFLGLIVS